jgi:hypothetical protein
MMECNSCDVFTWKNKFTSGIILASVNLCFLTLWISEMNLFSLVCYILLFYVVAGIIITKFLYSKKESVADDDHYEHISKETIEKLIKSVYHYLIQYNKFFQKVVSLEDQMLTIKYLGGLMVINQFSSWFCECFMIWLVINIAFLWAPVYSNYKDLIDENFNKGKELTYKYYEVVKANIPRYIDEKERSK